MTPPIPRGWSRGSGYWYLSGGRWMCALQELVDFPYRPVIVRTNPAALDDPNKALRLEDEARVAHLCCECRSPVASGQAACDSCVREKAALARAAAQPEPAPAMVPGMMRLSSGALLPLGAMRVHRATNADTGKITVAIFSVGSDLPVFDNRTPEQFAVAYAAAFEFTEREIGRLRAEGARQADGDDLTAAYFLGSRDAKPAEPERLPASKPPEDGRDVIVIAPVGEVLGWYDSLHHHWAVYDEDGESIEIDPADVLGWRELPRAIIRDGRVVGVAHG